MRKVTILVFTVLLMYSSFQGNVFAQYKLPEYNRTVEYVRNLIDSYNILLQNSTYVSRPDFDSINENLTLYHDSQHSFQVVVLQSTPYNSDYVALLFATIQADQPNVTMDYNDTFDSVFPHMFATVGEYALLEKNTIAYGESLIQVPLILLVLASDISGEYQTNAKSAAQYIYQQDVKQIPTHMFFKRGLSETINIGNKLSATLTPANPNFLRYLTVTETQTTATTVVSTTTIQSGENLVTAIISNPLSWFVGLILIALGAFRDYYGSYREGIRVLQDKEERSLVEAKAAKSVIRRVIRLFVRKKKVQEVKS